MANKKGSDEDVMTKVGLDANMGVRIFNGATGDNYQIDLFGYQDAIPLTKAAALTLIGTPASVMLGSDYKLTSLGITGIDHIIISGRVMATSGSALAYVTALSKYVPCDYDLSTNTISYITGDQQNGNYTKYTGTGLAGKIETFINGGISTSQATGGGNFFTVYEDGNPSVIIFQLNSQDWYAGDVLQGNKTHGNEHLFQYTDSDGEFYFRYYDDGTYEVRTVLGGGVKAPIIKLDNQAMTLGDVDGAISGTYLKTSYKSGDAYFDFVTGGGDIKVNGVPTFTGTALPTDTLTIVNGLIMNAA